MAFTASDRVRVTSQKSDHRGLMGTVVRAAEDTPHGELPVQPTGA